MAAEQGFKRVVAQQNNRVRDRSFRVGGSLPDVQVGGESMVAIARKTVTNPVGSLVSEVRNVV